MSHGSDGSEQEENMETDTEDVDDSIVLEFQIECSEQHQYLFRQHVALVKTKEYCCEAHEIIRVPIVRLPIVVFPAQKFPFIANQSILLNKVRYALSHHNLMALNTSIKETDVATLIQITKYQECPDAILFVAIAQHRCQILNRQADYEGETYGEVVILEEKELPPFSHLFAPSPFSRLPPNVALRYYSAMTQYPEFVFKPFMPETISNELTVALKNWTKVDPAYTVDQLGLAYWSDWMASNFPLDFNKRLELLQETSPNRRIIILSKLIKKCKCISCASCTLTLAQTPDMINMSSAGNSAHYVSPDGSVHDLLTVSKISGTRGEDFLYPDFSWFPGYKWKIHVCSFCGIHVGWEYISAKLKPHRFFGLTRYAISVD